jgi:hypothetical protein
MTYDAAAHARDLCARRAELLGRRYGAGPWTDVDAVRLAAMDYALDIIESDGPQAAWLDALAAMPVEDARAAVLGPLVMELLQRGTR